MNIGGNTIMNIGAIPVPITDRFFQQLAASLPTQVRCRWCHHERAVNPAHCLQRGWPTCCGETMELFYAPAGAGKFSQKTTKV